MFPAISRKGLLNFNWMLLSQRLLTPSCARNWKTMYPDEIDDNIEEDIDANCAPEDDEDVPPTPDSLDDSDIAEIREQYGMGGDSEREDY